MSNPVAYCVKCKTHTDTLGKHTIVLGNKRRALKGVCPVCATEIYRFMPKKDETRAAPELSVILSMQPIRFGKPVPSPALPDTFAKHLNEHGRVTLGQELFFYGSLLVVLGLTIAIGFVVIARIF